MLIRPGTLLSPNQGDGITVADFDADYQAVLSRADTLGYTKPSFAQQIEQNRLLLQLKAAGIWAKLDVFYVFANDGSSEFATLNWKSPSANQATLINSPAFTPSVGFSSDGSTSYLSSNYNPATFGGQRTLNSAHVAAWTSGLSGSGLQSIIMGATTSDVDGIVYGSASTVLQRLHNGTTSLPSAVTVPLEGFQMLCRANSSTLNYYNGTTPVQTRTVTSTVIGNTMLGLRRGTTTAMTWARLHAMSSGADLTAESNDYRAALTAYMGAI